MSVWPPPCLERTSPKHPKYPKTTPRMSTWMIAQSIEPKQSIAKNIVGKSRTCDIRRRFASVWKKRYRPWWQPTIILLGLLVLQRPFRFVLCYLRSPEANWFLYSSRAAAASSGLTRPDWGSVPSGRRNSSICGSGLKNNGEWGGT
jgi:hypothetical protein